VSEGTRTLDLQGHNLGADTVVRLDDLGSHPLHRLANALAFDHVCHLRNDILRPHGPIDRPAPPADALRVGATIEWLIAAVPQMSPPSLVEALDRPIALRLTGAGGGDWTLRAGVGTRVDLVEGTSGDEAATIISPATEFVIWATHRVRGGAATWPSRATRRPPPGSSTTSTSSDPERSGRSGAVGGGVPVDLPEEGTELADVGAVAEDLLGDVAESEAGLLL
jgi:hypothetical protein